MTTNYRLPTVILGVMILTAALLGPALSSEATGINPATVSSTFAPVPEPTTVVGTNKCEVVTTRDNAKSAELWCQGFYFISGNCTGAPSSTRLFQRIPASCGPGSTIDSPVWESIPLSRQG